MRFGKSTAATPVMVCRRMFGDGEVKSRNTVSQRLVAGREVTRSAIQCVWSVGDSDFVAVIIQIARCVAVTKARPASLPRGDLKKGAGRRSSLSLGSNFFEDFVFAKPT